MPVNSPGVGWPDVQVLIVGGGQRHVAGSARVEREDLPVALRLPLQHGHDHGHLQVVIDLNGSHAQGGLGLLHREGVLARA